MSGVLFGGTKLCLVVRVGFSCRAMWGCLVFGGALCWRIFKEADLKTTVFFFRGAGGPLKEDTLNRTPFLDGFKGTSTGHHLRGGGGGSPILRNPKGHFFRLTTPFFGGGEEQES